MSADDRTRWGARAAALYDDAYAAQYRAHDDTVRSGVAARRFGEWLHAICRRFAAPIDVLDLGCGTGRYFHALTNVRRLVGIDVSAPMLERARRPIGDVAIPADRVALVEGDFLTCDFADGEFDLVYSIGVLGEHSPFDESIASRVAQWLRPDGRFAFTTVHPQSLSVPRTWARRLGEAMQPVAPHAIRTRLRARLMSGGLYADEARVAEVLDAAGLDVESIGQFRSDVHLHVLAVAVKTAFGVQDSGFDEPESQPNPKSHISNPESA